MILLAILVGACLVLFDYAYRDFEDLATSTVMSLASFGLFATILAGICFQLDLPFFHTLTTPPKGFGGRLLYMVWATFSASVIYSSVFMARKVNGDKQKTDA